MLFICFKTFDLVSLLLISRLNTIYTFLKGCKFHKRMLYFVKFGIAFLTSDFLAGHEKVDFRILLLKRLQILDDAGNQFFVAFWVGILALVILQIISVHRCSTVNLVVEYSDVVIKRQCTGGHFFGRAFT